MQKPVEVTGIWLHSSGHNLHVCAEIDGTWRRLFTEHRFGPISHIIEPAGMRTAPVEPLAQEDGAVSRADGDYTRSAPGPCFGEACDHVSHRPPGDDGD